MLKRFEVHDKIRIKPLPYFSPYFRGREGKIFTVYSDVYEVRISEDAENSLFFREEELDG
jgi:ribosomal protein L21E